MQSRVYSSSQDHSLGFNLKEAFKGYSEGFYLSTLFVRRGFTAKYKTSFIGYIWEIVPSITTAIIWIFLRGVGAISTPDVDIPFPVFVIIGSLMWSVITESIGKPLSSFNEYSSILSKINIPKEAVLLIGFFNILVNHAIKLILVLFLLIIYKITPGISLLLFFPLLFMTIVFFMTLGVILMPFEYMLSDLAKIRNYLLMALMYLTPVVYSKPKSGILLTIMENNPLSQIINALRNTLVGLPVDNIGFFLVMICVTAVLFLVASVFYRITVPIIIQRIGS